MGGPRTSGARATPPPTCTSMCGGAAPPLALPADARSGRWMLSAPRSSAPRRTAYPTTLLVAPPPPPWQDVLPALDTPREALTLAALLRLPLSMPRARKLRRVEELIEVLELGSCADICIGDSTFGARGLSGGQRRRVTSEGAGGGRVHFGSAQAWRRAAAVGVFVHAAACQAITACPPAAPAP